MPRLDTIRFAFALVLPLVASSAHAQSIACRRTLGCCQAVASAGGNPAACDAFRTQSDSVCTQALPGFAQAARAMGIGAQCEGGNPPGSTPDAPPVSCACVRATCDALVARHAADATTCAQLASTSGTACASAGPALLRTLQTLGGTVPAVCGSVAPTGGGGSTSPPGTPSDPGSPPPAGLPPEGTSTRHAPSGRLECDMVRDGHRVMVAGSANSFSVRCAGIPLEGNPTGSGGLAPPPQRSADGHAVAIHWANPPGLLAPLFSTATYTAPARANPADIEISATVTYAGQSVTVSRRVHLVPQRLHLDYRGEVVTHCTDLSHGSVIVGFDLVCPMGIDLTVSDGLAVMGMGGTSCGAGQLSSLQLCGPGETSAEAIPGWSLDGVSGQIDSESGVMTLQVDGHRVGGLTVHFGSRAQTAHTNPLFVRPFTLSPDDGSTRSFGSLTTNASAGSTNTFTVHAR